MKKKQEASSMEILLRSLYLLPLLFISSYSQFFFEDPFEVEIDRAEHGKHPEFETDYKGKWELVSKSSGASAMHMILLPTNKAIMYDATVFGPSEIPLAKGNCRPVPGKPKELDCWAHAVEYDIETAELRPLKVYLHWQ